MRRALLLIVLLLLAACTESSPPAATPAPPPAASAPSEPLAGTKEADAAIGVFAMGKDPVCGQDVDLNGGPLTRTWGDTTHVFCGEECAGKFDADPKAYAGQSKKK